MGLAGPVESWCILAGGGWRPPWVLSSTAQLTGSVYTCGRWVSKAQMGSRLVTVSVSLHVPCIVSHICKPPEGSTGPTTCVGVWIQELCSARSLRCPEQLLWPPLSLSSRSSLTSGRELLEARARVCLRSAPARDPRRASCPPPCAQGHVAPVHGNCWVYQSGSFPCCQCAHILMFPFEFRCCKQNEMGTVSHPWGSRGVTVRVSLGRCLRVARGVRGKRPWKEATVGPHTFYITF